MTARMIVGSSSEERPLGDHYPTPEIAITKLLDAVPFSGQYWEPCCGDGAISTVLDRYGHSGMSSDLYDWGYGETGIDFLKERRDVDFIITNPPYVIGLDFAKHALTCTEAKGGKVAFLMRLAWLESMSRKEFFEASPLKEVLVFSKRLPRMNKPGYDGKKSGGVLAFAWFVWEHGYDGSPTIRWI